MNDYKFIIELLKNEKLFDRICYLTQITNEAIANEASFVINNVLINLSTTDLKNIMNVKGIAIVESITNFLHIIDKKKL